MGGEDVVRVPVEVLAGSVVAHGGTGSAWRAAICTSRRSTPASSTPPAWSSYTSAPRSRPGLHTGHMRQMCAFAERPVRRWGLRAGAATAKACRWRVGEAGYVRMKACTLSPMFLPVVIRSCGS